MMIAVLAVLAAFIGWLTYSHGPSVQFFLNMLGGMAAQNVLLPAIQAYAYARRVFMRLMLFLAAYLGLFLFFVATGWNVPALIMALVACAVVFAFSYICYVLQQPVGLASVKIQQWSQGMLDKELLLRVEFSGQEDSKVKTAVAGLINLGLIPVNVPYVVVIGIPRRVVGGLAADLASLAQMGFFVVRYLSRMGMVVALYIMSIVLLLLLGMKTGKHFLTIHVIGVFSLVLLLAVMYWVLKDWKFPYKGMPTLGVPPLLLNIFLLIVIAFAVIDPRPARAFGQILENAHNRFVKGAEGVALASSGSSHRWFKVTKPIKRTYVRNRNGGFDLTKDPTVPSGRFGILIGENDTSGPTPVTLVAFQDKKTDPDMMNYESDASKLNWRWVPTDTVEEISNKPGEPSNAAIAVPISSFTASGWDYGPVVEYAGHPTPVGVWMGGAGAMTYSFSLSEIPTDATTAKIDLVLSGELHRDRELVQGDGASNVQVKVNDSLVPNGTVDVVRDNDMNGQPYSFTVPASSLRVGNNTLTLVVGEGGKQNGLNVWAIRPNTAAVLTF